ncbi:hypothetical protein Ciccas_009892, partial [Cichlidogyrus casuarinus]
MSKKPNVSFTSQISQVKHDEKDHKTINQQNGKLEVPPSAKHNSSYLPNNLSTQVHLHKRRRAALMLMVVVFMFFICYLPTHIMEILSMLDILHHMELKTIEIIVLLVHLVCFSNSCVNPIIYNFMS